MGRDEELKIPLDDDLSSRPKKKKCCNCKNSACLKLYCECLKNGEECGPDCCCVDCKNIEGNSERKLAVNTLISRN